MSVSIGFFKNASRLRHIYQKQSTADYLVEVNLSSLHMSKRNYQVAGELAEHLVQKLRKNIRTRLVKQNRCVYEQRVLIFLTALMNLGICNNYLEESNQNFLVQKYEIQSKQNFHEGLQLSSKFFGENSIIYKKFQYYFTDQWKRHQIIEQTTQARKFDYNSNNDSTYSYIDQQEIGNKNFAHNTSKLDDGQFVSPHDIQEHSYQSKGSILNTPDFKIMQSKQRNVFTFQSEVRGQMNDLSLRKQLQISTEHSRQVNESQNQLNDIIYRVQEQQQSALELCTKNIRLMKQWRQEQNEITQKLQLKIKKIKIHKRKRNRSHKSSKHRHSSKKKFHKVTYQDQKQHINNHKAIDEIKQIHTKESIKLLSRRGTMNPIQTMKLKEEQEKMQRKDTIKISNGKQIRQSSFKQKNENKYIDDEENKNYFGRKMSHQLIPALYSAKQGRNKTEQDISVSTIEKVSHNVDTPISSIKFDDQQTKSNEKKDTQEISGQSNAHVTMVVQDQGKGAKFLMGQFSEQSDGFKLGQLVTKPFFNQRTQNTYKKRFISQNLTYECCLRLKPTQNENSISIQIFQVQDVPILICEESLNQQALEIILNLIQIEDVLPVYQMAKNCQNIKQFMTFYLFPFIGIQHEQNGSIGFQFSNKTYGILGEQQKQQFLGKKCQISLCQVKDFRYRLVIYKSQKKNVRVELIFQEDDHSEYFKKISSDQEKETKENLSYLVDKLSQQQEMEPEEIAKIQQIIAASKENNKEIIIDSYVPKKKVKVLIPKILEKLEKFFKNQKLQIKTKQFRFFKVRILNKSCDFRIYYLGVKGERLEIILKNGFETFAPQEKKIEAEGRLELPMRKIYQKFGIRDKFLDDGDRKFIFDIFLDTFSLQTFDKELRGGDVYRYDKNPIRQDQMFEEGYMRRYIGKTWKYPVTLSLLGHDNRIKLVKCCVYNPITTEESTALFTIDEKAWQFADIEERKSKLKNWVYLNELEKKYYLSFILQRCGWKILKKFLKVQETESESHLIGISSHKKGNYIGELENYLHEQSVLKFFEEK